MGELRGQPADRRPGLFDVDDEAGTGRAGRGLLRRERLRPRGRRLGSAGGLAARHVLAGGAGLYLALGEGALEAGVVTLEVGDELAELERHRLPSYVDLSG